MGVQHNGDERLEMVISEDSSPVVTPPVLITNVTNVYDVVETALRERRQYILEGSVHDTPVLMSEFFNLLRRTLPREGFGRAIRNNSLTGMFHEGTICAQTLLDYIVANGVFEEYWS